MTETVYRPDIRQVPDSPWPEYVSHKRVRAVKIVMIEVDCVTIALPNGCVSMIEVPLKLFARGEAKPGDYLVVYDDGYMSWSPAKAFEDGYTLAP